MGCQPALSGALCHPRWARRAPPPRRQVQERLAQWPLARLQREGLLLLGLAATKRGSLYGRPIHILRRADRLALPFHRFT